MVTTPHTKSSHTHTESPHRTHEICAVGSYTSPFESLDRSWQICFTFRTVMRGPRHLTTIKTQRWSYPMRKKVPFVYHSLLVDAPADPITTDDLIEFAAQKPGIDKSTWNNSSRSWFDKFKKQKTEVQPNKLPVGFTANKEFSSFVAWVEANDEWSDKIAIESGKVVINLDTDLYALWDAVHLWTLFRQRQTGTPLDNGWFRHAVRLAARYQFFTLTGRENWHAKGPMPR